MSDHTLLLLHGETLTDASNNHVPITNNGVTVSSSQSKFGGKSLYFDGKSYATFPRSAAIYGSKDFTVDWWERPDPSAGSRYSSNWTVYGGLELGYGGNRYNVGSAQNAWVIKSYAFTTTPGEWTHFAIVRYGNRLTLYKNGVKVDEYTINFEIWQGANSNHLLGANNSTLKSMYKGYIDEFRISDIARWTSNFTPPDKPYVITKPPTKNSVMIDGTIYKIEGGNTMVNGAIHKIEKGNVLTAGTIRTIEIVKPAAPATLTYQKTGDPNWGSSRIRINGHSYEEDVTLELEVGDEVEISVWTEPSYREIFVTMNSVEVVHRLYDATYKFTISNNCSITVLFTYYSINAQIKM